MTVQELIDKLQQVEDKSILVGFAAEDRGRYYISDFSPIYDIYEISGRIDGEYRIEKSRTLILSHE